ncbi:Hypothetical predicted protein [Pelobates cultripes]|uniref:Uncharacterized protein n=1 Tax=Pelobates cultripes TaxID=61616 RepID=A0AAD1RVG5_PELCU|nr:Hypothetical predicted protein [Pelobates cultripes]
MREPHIAPALGATKGGEVGALTGQCARAPKYSRRAQTAGYTARAHQRAGRSIQPNIHPISLPHTAHAPTQPGRACALRGYRNLMAISSAKKSPTPQCACAVSALDPDIHQ